jgi:hypothetical protein
VRYDALAVSITKRYLLPRLNAAGRHSQRQSFQPQIVLISD